MKVSISKTTTEEIELPRYFKTDIYYYKVLDEEYVLVIYPNICIARWVVSTLKDTVKKESIVEITEEQFLTEYHKAADRLAELAVKEALLVEETEQV